VRDESGRKPGGGRTIAVQKSQARPEGCGNPILGDCLETGDRGGLAYEKEGRPIARRKAYVGIKGRSARNLLPGSRPQPGLISIPVGGTRHKVIER